MDTGSKSLVKSKCVLKSCLQGTFPLVVCGIQNKLELTTLAHWDSEWSGVKWMMIAGDGIMGGAYIN